MIGAQLLPCLQLVPVAFRVSSCCEGLFGRPTEIQEQFLSHRIATHGLHAHERNARRAHAAPCVVGHQNNFGMRLLSERHILQKLLQKLLGGVGDHVDAAPKPVRSELLASQCAPWHGALREVKVSDDHARLARSLRDCVAFSTA